MNVGLGIVGAALAIGALAMTIAVDPSPNAAGYRLLHGPAVGALTNRIELGTNRQWFIEIVAVGTNGVESVPATMPSGAYVYEAQFESASDPRGPWASEICLGVLQIDPGTNGRFYRVRMERR